jgi:hypothetical protein
VTVGAVPILVSCVCAETCQWCIKQWVTVAAVGIFASVASVGVLPVWRTRHYIYACNGQSHAGEGRCSQTLFFWYEIRGARAAVSISCALGVTSTYVSHFSSYCAVRPANRSSFLVRVFVQKFLKFLCELRDNNRL